MMKGISPMERVIFISGWNDIKAGQLRWYTVRCVGTLFPRSAVTISPKGWFYENEVHTWILSEREWVRQAVEFTALSLKSGGRTGYRKGFGKYVRKEISRFEYLNHKARSESEIPITLPHKCWKAAAGYPDERVWYYDERLSYSLYSLNVPHRCWKAAAGLSYRKGD